MYEIESPPQWEDIFLKESKRLPELLASPEVSQLLSKANQKYLHWDKFRYQPMPNGLTPPLAWALLKISRMGNRERLPIKSEKQKPFSIFLSKEHLKSLSYIDSLTSGAIALGEKLPAGSQQDRLIINGLIEEAISSSQIEGANTTRKVAKAMIELNRSPKNKDERMILNNYVAMTRLEEWKGRKLDDAFLLELHKVLMNGTMEEESDEGRFRTDTDEVVVSDKLTGNTVHIPPKFEDAREQLKQLYDFANSDGESDYVHPFVKASILHFHLGYIHPFVDGNGRSARAIFYWYLLKENYWMFKFLPISLQIKKKDSRPGYDRAFQYVESDEGDVTYFLSYKLKVACKAIDDFIKYLEKKQREANKLKELLVVNEEINQRQLDLIDFFQRNPNAEIDLQTYKNRNKVAYQTARTDLLSLASKRILKQISVGKKYLFMRGEGFPSK
jgi:Fic family protein